MKIFVAALLLASSAAFAQDKIKMSFPNEELTKVIEVYSKATGQKFAVDPGVRGKVSLFIPEPVSAEEAFNQLSTALALNGFGISKQGDTMVVRSARNLQRDLIEVSKERPSLKPERMYTWIYTLKHVTPSSVNRDLRILPSKDGELSVYENTNQLIISDWVSSLNRIGDILQEIDKPADPVIMKRLASERKERQERKVESGKKKTESSKSE